MRLQMPLKHRIGVCLLLGLGFIVTIAGVIRTCKQAWPARLSSDDVLIAPLDFIWKSLLDSWDVTWYSYPLWICAAIEIDLAVVRLLRSPPPPAPRTLTPSQICACAPALKPLLHQPILRITSRISTKLSSVLRSRGSNSQTSSNKNSSTSTSHRNAFRFAQGESQGDEEYGMLQRSQHSDKSAIEIAYIPADAAEERGAGLNPWSSRRSSAHLPPFHIVKRQSLEQEISYFDPLVSPLVKPKRCEMFDFR